MKILEEIKNDVVISKVYKMKKGDRVYFIENDKLVTGHIQEIFSEGISVLVKTKYEEGVVKRYTYTKNAFSTKEKLFKSLTEEIIGI